MDVDEILSHPFFLLVVGALITGLIIPLVINHLSNKWQKRQKGLEIKIDLVARMSQTIMKIMTALELTQTEIRKFKVDIETTDSTDNKYEKKRDKQENFKRIIQQDFSGIEEEYREFKVSSSVIGTQFEGYFPKSNMKEGWDELIEKVKELKDKIKLYSDVIERDFENGQLSKDATSIDFELQEKTIEILNKKMKMIRQVLGQTPLFG